MNERDQVIICRMGFAATRAIGTLNAARREACAEYNERIRKLRDLQVQLQIALDQKEDGFFKIETVLDPKLQRLISDPTHDL